VLVCQAMNPGARSEQPISVLSSGPLCSDSPSNRLRHPPFCAHLAACPHALARTQVRACTLPHSPTNPRAPHSETSPSLSPFPHSPLQEARHAFAVVGHVEASLGALERVLDGAALLTAPTRALGLALLRDTIPPASAAPTSAPPSTHMPQHSASDSPRTYAYFVTTVTTTSSRFHALYHSPGGCTHAYAIHLSSSCTMRLPPSRCLSPSIDTFPRFHPAAPFPALPCPYLP